MFYSFGIKQRAGSVVNKQTIHNIVRVDPPRSVLNRRPQQALADYQKQGITYAWQQVAQRVSEAIDGHLSPVVNPVMV